MTSSAGKPSTDRYHRTRGCCPRLVGLGVETVGTDAGASHSFDPPFPCHSLLLGAGKYGITQLQNLALLPATGAVVITGPLPITGGSGSPCRALALVEHS